MRSSTKKKYPQPGKASRKREELKQLYPLKTPYVCMCVYPTHKINKNPIVYYPLYFPLKMCVLLFFSSLLLYSTCSLFSFYLWHTVMLCMTTRHLHILHSITQYTQDYYSIFFHKEMYDTFSHGQKPLYTFIV